MRGNMQLLKITFTRSIQSAAFRALIPLILSGCTGKEKEGKAENFALNGDTVLVNAHANVKSRLKTVTVHAEQYKPELLSAGTVKVIPNLYAEIAPPFSGRVTAVHLRLGLQATAGMPLFEMISSEFTDAQKLFFQAKSEYQHAELTLKRQQDLKANHVGSEKDVEEAETTYEVKQKEYQNAQASLKIFNVDVNTLVLGQPLVIRSPIAGEVIVNDVVMGQFIKSDDPPRAKVAELGKVWVVGMIKEKDLGFIHELAGAEITVSAFPGKKIIGTIYHIDEMIDEETRSVQVLIACDNPEHTLKPGMYVTVTFIEKPAATIFILEKALLQYNDKSYVLLQVGKDKYLKRYVETGVTDRGRVQILSGLADADVVISDGAFFLLDAK